MPIHPFRCVSSALTHCKVGTSIWPSQLAPKKHAGASADGTTPGVSKPRETNHKMLETCPFPASSSCVLPASYPSSNSTSRFISMCIAYLSWLETTTLGHAQWLDGPASGRETSWLVAGELATLLPPVEIDGILGQRWRLGATVAAACTKEMGENGRKPNTYRSIKNGQNPLLRVWFELSSKA